MITVFWKALDPFAKEPTKSNPEDAGWDFYSLEDVILQPDKPTYVRTGVAIAIPFGWYGQFQERSGLARNSGVILGGGVIDCGFRGEIGIIAHTIFEPLTVKAGSKIAQMCFHQVPVATFREVEELPPSVRGENGFGSSGT